MMALKYSATAATGVSGFVIKLCILQAPVLLLWLYLHLLLRETSPFHSPYLNPVSLQQPSYSFIITYFIG
jgi:hypothetical protein